METITMHYKAKNDINGNLRRCYVVYDATSKNGVNVAYNMEWRHVVAVYQDKSPSNISCYYKWYLDEGNHLIDNKAHRNVVDSIDVSVLVYNGFICLGKGLEEAKK